MVRFVKFGMLLWCLVFLVGCPDKDITSRMASIPEHLNPDYQPPDQTCPTESEAYPVTQNIDHIIITEVIHDINLEGDWWIELYNPTDKPISIENYSLKTPLFKLYNHKYNPDTHVQLNSNNLVIDEGTLSGEINIQKNMMFNTDSAMLSLPLAHKYIPPIGKEGDFFVYIKFAAKHWLLSEYSFDEVKSTLEIQPHEYLVLFRRADMYKYNFRMDFALGTNIQSPSLNPKIHYIHESYLTKQSNKLKRYSWQHGMFSTSSHDYAGVGLYDGERRPIDFVRFGTTTDQVMAATRTEWQGKNVPFKQPNKINHSYARRFPYQDTNQAADWISTIYPTPAAHNLWQNEPDADHDGIPDIAEDGLDDKGNLTACELFNGLPLYQYGARAGFTDLFLEVDFTSLGTQQVLSRKTNFFDSIKNTFSQHAPEYKIRTHIDLGQTYDEKMNPRKYNLMNSDLFAAGGQRIRKNIDPMAERTGKRDADGNYDISYKHQFYGLDPDQMDVRRFYLFRYGSFGYSPRMGGRGEAMIPDEAYSLPISFYVGGMLEGIGSIGTLQHEFGHSLNLVHSAGQGKVLRSYLSVMNYAYLYGVPLQNEADNLLYSMLFCMENFNQSMMQEFREKNILVNVWSTQNPEPELGLMPVFTKGRRANFNLDKVNEYKGFGYKEGPTYPVDFNCDGQFNQQVNIGQLRDADFDEIEKDYDEYEQIIRYANLKKIYINGPFYKPYLNIPLMSQAGTPSEATTLPPISVEIREPLQCDLENYLQDKKLRNREARP
ncbi:MAG: lamin tail domain-containing protein [Shewanellaceae bacterium]|nr:lamin tail domain-containing protein [Shewanellaceae bacterium]